MQLHLFDDVTDFINTLPEDVAGKIVSSLKSLELNETKGLTIKTLKGKIKEIIVKQYRLVFFILGETIYIVDGFKKQSQKTPKRMIEKTEYIYKKINENYEKQ